MKESEPEAQWLTRHSPGEWIKVAIGELERARAAFETRDPAAGIAAARRAAGMALNGALCVRPNERWGRKYVEHLKALVVDAEAPREVQEAARRLLEAHPPSGSIVALRTRSEEERLLEAARTVMAHAYAVVHGSLGRRP